jgi:hypothetical protein
MIFFSETSAYDGGSASLLSAEAFRLSRQG